MTYARKSITGTSSSGTDRFQNISDMVKSSAHPDRVQIIHLLMKNPDGRSTVKNIYEALHIDQPTASKHLIKMKRSGLLQRKNENGIVYYSINRKNHVANCICNCLKKA